VVSFRQRALSLAVALALAGCGTPCYVTTEPRSAEVYVDGKFTGVGMATFDTNGVVFNTYKVEARDKEGRVLDSREVDVRFGARSAVFAGVGLVGILFWPLLPLLPAAFFVGEPNPEHVHLHVPNNEPTPAPEPERIDRPVLEIGAPANGDEVAAHLALKGRARHWSGIKTVRVELDGKLVREVKPAEAPSELAFEVPLDVEATGHHVISVVAQGSRGADASEELRVTRLVPGTPPPPAPEKIPGLENR
jgi:hypothetical protein